MDTKLREGHRQRVKTRFLEEGLDHFTQHQMLELLLFYAIPRKDTCDVAHRLINHFGSLAAVLNADYNDLLQIPEVTPNAAALLTMMPQLSRAYLLDENNTDEPLSSLEAIAAYVIPFFCGMKTEAIYMLCLDSAYHPIVCKKLAEGNKLSVDFDTRQVAEIALRHQAVYVVMAHNHLSGLLLPSDNDLRATRHIEGALHTLHIRLLDHVIVAKGKAFSMKNGGGWGSNVVW